MHFIQVVTNAVAAALNNETFTKRRLRRSRELEQTPMDELAEGYYVALPSDQPEKTEIETVYVLSDSPAELAFNEIQESGRARARQETDTLR